MKKKENSIDISKDMEDLKHTHHGDMLKKLVV